MQHALRFLSLFAFLLQASPNWGADLALEAKMNRTEPRRGDTVLASVKLVNQGKTDVNNVKIQLIFSPGLKVGRFGADLGSFRVGSGLWEIGKMDAGLNETTLRIYLIVEGEGPLAVQAEIKQMDETDADSSPGNVKMGEDDLAFAYVTIPIVFCGAEAIKLTAEAFPGFTGYQWLRDGQLISGANERRLSITQVGRYTCTVNEAKNSDVVSFPVIVRQGPALQIELGETMQICAGKNLKIKANPNAGTPPYHFKWENDKGISLDEPLKAGEKLRLTVTVTDKMGCRTKDSVEVAVRDCGAGQ